MSKKIIVNNIHDLKFKLGEYFISEHINIKIDNMQISERFAKLLIKEPIKEPKQHSSTFYQTIFITHFNSARVTIYVRQSHDNRFYIAGQSGTYGFGGLQCTKKEYLGVRTRRIVNKVIVDYYLTTNLPRLEKIKKLLKK